MDEGLSEKKRKRKRDLSLALGKELMTWTEVWREYPDAAVATVKALMGGLPETWEGRAASVRRLVRKSGKTLWWVEGGRAWRARWPRPVPKEPCWLCGHEEGSGQVWAGLCRRCWAWTSNETDWAKERSRERMRSYLQRKKHR